MTPQSNSTPNRTGGSVIGGAILVIVIIMVIAGYVRSHQEAVVTTCNTVLQTCSQQTYPIQSTGP